MEKIQDKELLELGEKLFRIKELPGWSAIKRMEEILQKRTEGEILRADPSRENYQLTQSFLKGAHYHQVQLWKKRDELINEYEESLNERD